MATLHEHQSKALNLPPGALVHIGQRHLDEPKITVIEYVDEHFRQEDISVPKSADEAPLTFESLRKFPDSVLWVNVDGIHEPHTIAALGRTFGLHPLVLEDVMNAEQRPKLDEYDDCLFIVLKMLDYDRENEQIIVEQVSLVLGKGFVLTFQERVGDVFDVVRSRIKESAGKIRKLKADYLAYRLVDGIVDHYFVALEAMAEIVDDLEGRLAEDPGHVQADELHTLRRETLFLRKAIAPARELMSTLARLDDPELVGPVTQPYLRDVHDHILQVSESVEHTREILTSLLDVYHASLSNKMNEVMKVLAIVSAVFVPITFIAGVYGMNFHHMPELEPRWAYPVVLGVMGLIGLSIAAYTRRRRWW